MIFRKKTLYALKALIFLEKKGRMGTVTEIVKATEMPQKFLETIMVDLKRNGLIESFNGRNGGYELLKPLDEIFLDEILDFTEPQISKPENCDRNIKNECKVQNKLDEFSQNIIEEYQRKIKTIKVSDFAF